MEVTLIINLNIPLNLSRSNSPISNISKSGAILPKFKSLIVIFDASIFGDLPEFNADVNNSLVNLLTVQFLMNSNLL